MHQFIKVEAMKKICMLWVAVLIIFTAGCGGGGGSSSGSNAQPVSEEKSITAFSLNGVAATINETEKTITVSMPYGTNVTALVATFTTTGASVKVGSNVQTSGTTSNNFTNPVIYTVMAIDDSAQDYTVIVTVVSSSAKEITAFSLNGVVGTINETYKTIAVTMPYGTNVTSLVATFTTTGAGVKIGSDVQTSGTTSNDFSDPVVYTVAAANASTQDYTITVTLATSSSKEITWFSLNNVVGTINQTNRTIAVTLPYGTSVTSLVAAFAATGVSVNVDSEVQVSGTTANDFTNPVVYTVAAADSSTQDYTVTVTVAQISSSKMFRSFSLNGIAGTISEAGKTIAVTMPYGTNVTALVATFTTTGVSVKVGSTVQASGTTSNDYTSPVVYTVTAQDASTQDYTVTVTLAPPTYSISGTVSGDIMSGVTIVLSGSGSSSITTDSNGNYNFSGLNNGNYTITPSKTDYAFNPTSISATVNNANLTGQNFTSVSTVIPTYTISGKVSGAVAAGVTITLTGTGSSTTTTDSNGNYSFDNAENGSYTLTASLSGCAFSPGSISVTVAGADVTGQNFTSVFDYTGTYNGTMRVGIFSGTIRLIITSYSETTLTGSVEDFTFGYGLREITTGYISGNYFYSEGYDAESDTTLTASGTFSSDGRTLSGTFQTSSGISGTMEVTKE
jgi:hypothetical protein